MAEEGLGLIALRKDRSHSTPCQTGAKVFHIKSGHKTPPPGQGPPRRAHNKIAIAQVLGPAGLFSQLCGAADRGLWMSIFGSSVILATPAVVVECPLCTQQRSFGQLPRTHLPNFKSNAESDAGLIRIKEARPELGSNVLVIWRCWLDKQGLLWFPLAEMTC